MVVAARRSGSGYPIFAAIEAHKAAVARFEAAVERVCRLEDELPEKARRSSITAYEHVIVETDDPRWIESEKAVDETCDVVDELEHRPYRQAFAWVTATE